MRREGHPEQRVAELLQQSGWVLGAVSGPRAIAEAALGPVRADYGLLVDDRLLGVVEVKRAVSDAGAQQMASTLRRLSETQGADHGGPLVGYVSNGRETVFIPASVEPPREVAGFHTPQGLLRLRSGRPPWLAELSEAQAPLPQQLLPHQVEAVRAIQESLTTGDRRLLLAVAAGAGRTSIAAAFIDRLLRCTSARRVLVLADHRLIGEQFRAALADFETWDGRRLGEDYGVHIADRLRVEIDAHVVVTSAARLEHMASKEFELPLDHFDLVWTDEPESLSGSTWQRVLDRFDAPLVGITTHPTPETFAFFDGNLVAAIDIDQLLLSGRRPEVDRGVVDAIWQRVEAQRGRTSPEEALAQAFVEGSPALTWRELTALLDRLGSAGVRQLPGYVIEFVAEYLRGRGVAFALDPSVSNPALLSAVVEADGAEGAHGQAVSPLSWQLAHGLQSDVRLSWSTSNDDHELAAPVMQPGLVLSAPPLGLREVEAELRTTSGQDIRVRDRAEHVWLAESAQWLAEDGEALWLVSDSFFTAKRGSVAAALVDLGLHIHAALTVRDSRASGGLPSSLVLVRKVPSEDIFVGELSPAIDVNQLVSHLRRRHRGPVPALGRVVPSADFAGPGQAARRERLDELLADAPGELVPLADILASPATRPARDADFEVEPNSVYLPTFVGSPAHASLEHITSKPWAYFQLPLDPGKALAEYVARLLNTDLGQALREDAAGGSVHPSLSRRSLERLHIPLPPVDAQQRAVATHARIRALRLELDSLERRLDTDPSEAPNVDHTLDRLGQRDLLVAFREALPFPLASILWRYEADDDVGGKVQLLYRFFEACAIYFSTVLLSGFANDKELFAAHKERWFKKLRPNSFNRSNFGTWVLFGRRLTSSTRGMLGDEAGRARLLSAFSFGSVRFLEALANQELWGVLETASEARNDERGHGGLPGPEHHAANLATALGLLTKVMELVGEALDDVLLVRPLTTRRRSGVTSVQVHLLQGSQTTFRKTTVTTLANQVPDESELFLVSATEQPAPSLLLLRPFVRLKPSPPDAPNACYFYSKLQEDGTVKFISHHFEREPTVAERDPDVRAFIDELQEPAPR